MLNRTNKIYRNVLSYYNRRKEINRVKQEKIVRASFRVDKAAFQSNYGKRYRHDKHLTKWWENTEEKSVLIAFADLAHYIAVIFTAFVHFISCLLIKAHIVLPSRWERCKSGDQSYCTMNNSLLERLDDDELLAHVFFVGLDCEMVGVGKGGEESMLARCSCCCFEDESRSKIKVLFDKFIRPTKAVTDYRTEFSGITPEILKRQDGSVVTFEQCRNYVLQLLSSTPDGRVVVCVGHGLENDFEVLKIQHPRILTRDTSLYPPFMHVVRSKRYKRKLSALVEEHLGFEIQKSSSVSPLSAFISHQGGSNMNGNLGGPDSHNTYDNYDAKFEDCLGHCSVEDSAATLLLYSKVSNEWEKSLNFPLRRYFMHRLRALDKNPTQNNITLYIDGCNVPIGLRRWKNYEDYPCFSAHTESSIDSTRYQLISTINTCLIDWTPIVRSIVLNPLSSISKVVFMFDGVAFKNVKEQRTGLHTLHHPSSPTVDSEATQISSCKEGGIYLHISDKDKAVDDIIVECCKNDLRLVDTKEMNHDQSLKMVMDSIVRSTASHVSEYFERLHSSSNGERDRQPTQWYAVIRRNGSGGTKTKKLLFEKYHLRRPHEGALCLFPSLWPHILAQGKKQRHNSSVSISLEEDSHSTMNDLQNISNVDQLLEFQLRPFQMLRSIVVTNDVLLADRVVKEGGAVLSYRQWEQALL